MKLRSTVTGSCLIVSLVALQSCRTRPTSVDDAVIQSAPPSNMDRTVTCDLGDLAASKKKTKFRGKEIEYFSSEEIGYHTDNWHKGSQPWNSYAALDSTLIGSPGYPSPDRSFAANADDNVRLTVVDIRKIGGKMYYHYFSNETAESPIENWSSTKALAMLQAAHSIRKQTDWTHGLRSTLNDGRWIGEHVTEVARNSTNGTAGWFKSITGPQGGQNFIRNWIGTDAEFGGLHSVPPFQLGNRVKQNDTGAAKLLLYANSFEAIGNNTLKPVVMAEFWKRLAVNRLDSRTWLKKRNYAGSVLSAEDKKSFFDENSDFSVTDEDLKVLLYGFVDSKSEGGLMLGATQHEEFIRAFGGQSKLNQLTGGKWRLMGKTGSGDARGRREAVFGGFLCIPQNPNRSELKEGKLLAFFTNTQSRGSASPARLRALKGIADTFVPTLNGASNLFAESSAPPVVPQSGTVTISTATALKSAPVDSGTLEGVKQKCSAPVGLQLKYTSKELSSGQHTKLVVSKLPEGCEIPNNTVFVFTPHLAP